MPVWGANWSTRQDTNRATSATRGEPTGVPSPLVTATPPPGHIPTPPPGHIPTPPPEVRRWAEERAEARSARDFGRADELRTLIAKAGWEVLDTPGGYELRPAGPPPPAVSVLLDVEGWPDDTARFMASLDLHSPGLHSPGAELVPVEGRAFATARNAALSLAAGEVVALVDTSLELTGDLFGPLVSALADSSVAVVGPYGLATGDLRNYQERTAGEVAAIQGYCLAARRSDLLAAGGLRETFTFYRNADIDLSFRLRTLGGEVRRALAVGADRCRRHTHRAWEATDPEERERLSRRNMLKVLDRFGDRLDLIVP